MADFPVSKHSFATFANGATSDAAQVTDIYAEVEAIEDGYLNGTARLNSSNSTVANLSVAGGSTLAGALSAGASTLASLNVTGASTLAGNVTFGGTVTFTGAVASAVTLSSGATVSTGVVRQNSLPAWNVFHSTHVPIAAGSSVGFAFDTEDFIRGDIGHSTGANSSRITINTTGVYMVGYHGRARSTGNPRVKVYIRQNDVTNLFAIERTLLANAPYTRTLDGWTPLRIASTCYLTCVAASSNAVASTHGSSSPWLGVRFMGYFLG